MGAIYDFEKEKLIVGVIYHDAEVLNIAMERLIAAFGEVLAVERATDGAGKFYLRTKKDGAVCLEAMVCTEPR